MHTTPPESADTGAEQRRAPKLWVRLVAFIAVLLTGWHILASFLWIAPYSANAREIVPGGQNTLTAYMIPFFGQSWSVFAPEPINGDYHFNVRATIVDENGEESETGWVSATDVELSMIQYNLFPPRAGIQSSEIASNYKDAFDSLEAQQRAIVEADFVVEDWEIGLRAAVESQHSSAQQSGEGENAEEAAPQTPLNTAEIDQILAEEHRTTAYATQVAKAVWGDQVTKVQFRVSRQNIIPFTERHDPQAQRPEPTIVLPGWRAPVVEDGQNEDNFADVFRGQFERITG